MTAGAAADGSAIGPRRTTSLATLLAREAELVPIGSLTAPERVLVDRLLPIGALFLLLAEAARTRGRVGAPAVAAGVVALAVGNLAKLAVRRERPSARPASGAKMYSFPSTHAATAVAVATSGMALASPATALAVYALVGLAALGRIRDGRHYPSDVLAGGALGAAVGAAGRALARRTAIRRET